MRSNQRGDTIIEVILAVTLLSLVTVSAFTVMQRASASAYDALERSSVRLKLNGQIELLNYFRDAYADALASNTAVAGTPAEVWSQIVARTPTAVPTLQTCNAPAGAFYLSKTVPPAALKYQIVTSTIPRATGLPTPGDGLWIARIDSDANAPQKRYQEFYVIACWPTTTGGEQRMSSVVRMYDPR